MAAELWWKQRKSGSKTTISMRLPGFLVSQYATHAHYDTGTCRSDGQRYRYLQFLRDERHGLAASGVPPALLGYRRGRSTSSSTARTARWSR